MIRFGDPALPENFWNQVLPEPNCGCWLWTGSDNGKGYARFSLNGRPWRAHRLVYEVLVGLIPDGLHLDHLCRVRCCVNPTHLEPVTNKTNLLRGTGFAAMNVQKTHCPQGHQYSGANLIIENGKRKCRACVLEKAKKYRKRKRMLCLAGGGDG